VLAGIRAFVRLRVRGREHVPLDGAFLLVANHASHADTPALTAALPRAVRRRLVVAAAEDHFFRGGLLGRVSRALFGLVPVRRGGDADDPLAGVRDALLAGQPVLLFPEGTRTRDGTVGPFRRGVARLAAETGAPVVPAWIEGAARALPPTARLPRPRRMEVRFGPPLRDLGRGEGPAAWDAAAAEAREHVLALAPPRSRRPLPQGPVQPRHRLDITPRQALRCAVRCAHPRPRRRGVPPDALVTLSVRAGWELVLDALDLQPGDEVLMSAITHPDMARSVRRRGLVPVPVDLDAATLAPTPATLAAAVGPRSRALIVAPLFGSRHELAAERALADRHALVLVEDGAQALAAADDPFTGVADVTLFSLGTIKTQTAAGGAVLHVRDDGLRAALADAHRAWPRQARRDAARRAGLALALATLGEPRRYGRLVRLAGRAGVDLDRRLATLVRGIADVPDEDYARRVRRRPSAPLEASVGVRLAALDAARIARRAAIGERLQAALGPALAPGSAATRRTHWLLPCTSPHPQSLVAALARLGVDCAGTTSSIRSVAAPPDRPGQGAAVAERLLDGMRFVPCYPELPDAVVERMAGVLRAHAREVAALA
jgi:1-acyl-sn-glycerol-3-phosphate acyltransferase